MESLWKRVLEHHALNKEKNTWLAQQEVEDLLRQLEEEMEEVRAALKGNGDLADEVADLLRDVLNIIALLDKRGLAGEREVLEAFVEKDILRKPWLYWEERCTSEEMVELWERAKAEKRDRPPHRTGEGKPGNAGRGEG